MGLYFSLKFFYFHAAPVGVSPEVSARGYVGAGLYLLLLTSAIVFIVAICEMLKSILLSPVEPPY